MLRRSPSHATNFNKELEDLYDIGKCDYMVKRIMLGRVGYSN